MSDEENRKLAIERAELLVRRLRTGDVTGFIAIATDDTDRCFAVMGGHVNLTQSVCLLEHQKLVALNAWIERFDDDEGGPTIGPADPEGT